MLQIVNLHKTYQNGRHALPILRGIDCSIPEGKIVAIVGPSGSGKSTLLNLIGGLDTPSGGKVLLDATDIFSLREDQRAEIRNTKIGYVFQFYYLLPEFTALENVAMPALLSKKYSSREAFQRAQHVLKEVMLQDRMDHKPKELSGGEQQRVAIARALVNDPEIVLCDEPTGNLDTETANTVLALLWRLNQEKKKTFVIVTHERSIAQASHQTFLLEAGKLV